MKTTSKSNNDYGSYIYKDDVRVHGNIRMQLQYKCMLCSDKEYYKFI